MTHYVKQTLQKKPKNIILHIGTNDLQRKSPDALIKAVTKLGEAITLICIDVWMIVVVAYIL
jgi:hypothetical protein